MLKIKSKSVRDLKRNPDRGGVENLRVVVGLIETARKCSGEKTFRLIVIV